MSETNINIESIDFSMYYIPYHELTGVQSNTKTSERPACRGFITLQKFLIRRLSPPTSRVTQLIRGFTTDFKSLASTNFATRA